MSCPCAIDEALPHNSPCLRRLCDEAKALRIGIVATAIAQGKVKPRNSAFFISLDDKILLRYDKMHTCDFADEACLEHGKGFVVCDFHGIRLGVMICYDREYPESARADAQGRGDHPRPQRLRYNAAPAKRPIHTGL